MSEALVPSEGGKGVLERTSPKEMVQAASEVAETLSALIEKQGLYADISGKRYPKVEAWTTCVAMLGIVPREVASVQRDDGSYESTVELARLSDDRVVGRASAVCGTEDDGVWAERSSPARKSMAATRATSKACRLSFAWIVALTGLQTTPAEEMEGVIDVKPAKPSGPVVPFGKNKGVAVSALTLSQLDWYIKRAEKNVADPNFRYQGTERQWLEVLREEHKSREENIPF